MVTMVGRSRSMVRFYFVCLSIVRAIIFEIACNGTQFLKKCKVIFFNGIWAFVFFFKQICQDMYFFFLYFFFPGNSLNFTHSLISEACIFFFRYRKKKIQGFHSLTQIWPKMSQKQTLPGIKKNGPFGPGKTQTIT